MEHLKDEMLFKVEFIPLKIKYLEKKGITAKKTIHRGWIESNQIRDSTKKRINSNNPKVMALAEKLKTSRPMGVFGKWHYIFTSKKGNISLVQLLDYNRIGQHLWEIFCIDGNKGWLGDVGDEKKVPASYAKEKLPDTERFIRREDAIIRIIEILREKKDEQKSAA